MKVQFNKGFNVQRLVKKLLYTILALFVGGIALQYFIIAMNGTCSPFYNGLSLIGVNVSQSGNGTAGAVAGSVVPWACTTTGLPNANTIVSPTMNTSLLSVVGILALIGVIMTEFIKW